MLKKLSASVQLLMVLLITLFATNAATLVTAYANSPSDGADSVTPYTVTAEKITLPSGTTFTPGSHVNYRVTALDGTKPLSFNVQNDRPSNGLWPNEQYIGQSTYGITDHPQFPSNLKTDGYCVTWVQVSFYNQHFGEGGQAPVCTTPPSTDSKKIQFCHATGSQTNPYELVNTSVNAFYGEGHGSHQNDIVPPFSYVKHGETINFAGLNWDDAHQAIYNNNCNVPAQKVTAAAPTFIDLCGTANDRYTVPTTDNVTYNPASGTYNNATGTVTVTATANQGYVLDGQSSFSHTFTNVDCPLTPVTAGEVTYKDMCGIRNDTITIPTTAHVTYTLNGQPVTGTIAANGTVTITASADKGYVLTAPYTFKHTFNSDACPTVNQCKTIRGTTTVHPSNLEGFSFSETLATGHYEFTNSGLHIWTEGAGKTDKVAAYKQTDVALADVGNPALNYTNNGGTLPGYQLYVDNGHGVKGFVVGEPASYGNNWWSKQDFGIGAGAGYASYGTLDQYLAANPDARVLAFGFSLGSGVKGDGVLKDITFNCYKWVFKADKEKPVTICHVNNWHKDSYDQLTVSARWASVHYMMDKNDIIPAFTYNGHAVPAKNWTTENQAIYNNGCKPIPLTCPAGTTWMDKNHNHKIERNECVTPQPPTDVCENIDGNQANMPAGYVLDDEGNCVQPGGKGGDDTEDTDTTATQVLGITKPTQPAELANTGTDVSTSLVTMLVGLTVISLALGSTFAVRKQHS